MPELLGLSLYNDANLQEYYKLEDLTGKNANNLTNNGAATFVAAKFGNGVSGGASDADKSLSIANALGWNGGAYAISFWAKVNTAPSSNTYNFLELFEGTNDTSILIEYVDTAGTKSITWHRLKVGVGTQSASFNVDLGTTNYHHIVWTYDGTTVKGYVNNVERASFAASGNGSTALATKFNIMAGRNDNTSGNFLGIIDDVALFNRNLTAAEVSTIYNDIGGIFSSDI